MEPSEDYEFVQGETGVRETCIQSKQKVVETIKINFLKIGDINITIEAATDPNSLPSCGTGTPPTKK